MLVAAVEVGILWLKRFEQLVLRHRQESGGIEAGKGALNSRSALRALGNRMRTGGVVGSKTVLRGARWKWE